MCTMCSAWDVDEKTVRTAVKKSAAIVLPRTGGGFGVFATRFLLGPDSCDGIEPGQVKPEEFGTRTRVPNALSA